MSLCEAEANREAISLALRENDKTMLTYVQGNGPTVQQVRDQIAALEAKPRDKTQDALLSMLKTCLAIRLASKGE
jgi:hypothetical protein